MSSSKEVEGLGDGCRRKVGAGPLVAGPDAQQLDTGLSNAGRVVAADGGLAGRVREDQDPVHVPRRALRLHLRVCTSVLTATVQTREPVQW